MGHRLWLVAGVSRQLRLEEEEEVGAYLNRSSRGFCVIHGFGGRDSAAAIGGGPVALVQDQDRSDLPPDWCRVHSTVINYVIVIGSGYENRHRRRSRFTEGCQCY